MPLAPYLSTPWLRVLTATAAVAVISWAMLLFTRTTTEVAVIWPTNALVIGAMVLAGRQLSGWFLTGACLATWVTSVLVRQDMGLLGSGMALAHAVEMCMAWVAVHRRTAEHPNLGHPRVLLHFTVFAVWLAPALSGAVAASVLRETTGTPWFETFKIWWAAHALGMALFAPLAVTFHPQSWARTHAMMQRPVIIPWLALVAVTLLVFTQSTYPLLFMLFPPLMWLVFRWGFAGACMGAMTALLLAFPLTYLGMGPMMLLADTSLAHRLFFLQVFMGTALLVMFPIGMILDHRERLMARLRVREAELERLAWHDPLTGLLNRRGFDQQLRTLAKQGPMAIVVLDLDHFKGYNDAYGHPEGDACLAWLGELLEDHTAASKGAAGRQGGEEFAAALPMTLVQAQQWAERLRVRIAQAARPHRASNQGHVTASFGVAAGVVHEPHDIDALLQAADRALYQAKQQGRNQVAVAP